MMKLLKCAVHVLHMLAGATSTILGRGISLVCLYVQVGSRSLIFPVLWHLLLCLQLFLPMNAIFTGLAILLSVMHFSQFLHTCTCNTKCVPPRQSKTSMLATMHLSTYSSQPSTSSTASRSISKSLLQYPWWRSSSK